MLEGGRWTLNRLWRRYTDRDTGVNQTMAVEKCVRDPAEVEANASKCAALYSIYMADIDERSCPGTQSSGSLGNA